jgi:hypothetical protein
MILNGSMLIPAGAGLLVPGGVTGACEPDVAQPATSLASTLLQLVYALCNLPYDEALPGFSRQPSCGVQHRHHHYGQQVGEHETANDGDRHGHKEGILPVRTTVNSSRWLTRGGMLPYEKVVCPDWTAH